MILTLLAQNLSHGGLRNDRGEKENRIPRLTQRIQGAEPAIDVLLISEAEGWDEDNNKHLNRVAQELDMETGPLSRPFSGFPTGLLYNPRTIGRIVNVDNKFSDETTHGFNVIAFDVGLPKPLSIVSTHINPFSKEKALSEVGLIASRTYRNGPYAIVGGDINFPPNDGIEPDFSKMRPYNRMARTVEENGNISSDRSIAQTLERAGYVDVALAITNRTNDKKLLRKTAGEYRIDQFWVSKPLEKAIVNYWILDKPVDASDHAGIVFQLDTDLIDTSEVWDWR